MNPIGATLTILITMLVFHQSRKIAALALLAGIMFLTQSQQISMGGFNLFAIRIIGFAAFVRVLIRGEFSFSRLVPMDRSLLVLYFLSTTIFCIRSSTSQAYAIATACDMVFGYFACRGLIQDLADFRALLMALIPMLLIYTGAIFFECFTHKNPFAVIGGISFGWVRHGRLRCFGSFRNPDLLGTLGASLMPLYIGLAFVKEYRRKCIIAVAACLAIAILCNSGGPLSVTAFSLLGWVMWRIRTRMQTVRRALVLMVISAGLLMKAPIWYLLARLAEVSGGDGWHRSYLMDVAYRHIDIWWLVGTSLQDTAEWFPYILSTTGAADITNLYISFGLQGGVGMIFLLLVLLTRSFRAVGRAMNVIRERHTWITSEEGLLWGMGVMLAGHVVNWFGITYFDQTYLLFCLQLAALASISDHVINAAPDEVLTRDEDQDESLELVPTQDYQPLN